MRLVKWLDNQTKLMKIVLALPIIDIGWVIYRTILSVKAKDWLGVILGILLIPVGIVFLWLIDIITVATKGYILWFKYDEEQPLLKEETQEIKK